MRTPRLSMITMAMAVLAGLASPSWARWHRGGWRGPHVGVYLGPDPWWWGNAFYDPYYYPPYYYAPYPYNGYAYPYPYANPYPARLGQQAPAPQAPDNSHHQLSEIEREIARARDTINFELEDGDLTKEEARSAQDNLSKILKEMRAQGAAHGGYLTGDEVKMYREKIWGYPQPTSTEREPAGEETSTNASPPQPSTGNAKAVEDQIGNLRRQVDKKFSTGDITKKQYEGLKEYLSNFQKRVQSDASANGGQLTKEQEEGAKIQLERVATSLKSNLIMPPETR